MARVPSYDEEDRQRIPVVTVEQALQFRLYRAILALGLAEDERQALELTRRLMSVQTGTDLPSLRCFAEQLQPRA